MTSAIASLSWPKTTARLSIRTPTADDVEPTWRYRRLPEVSQWITAAPATLEEYAAHFLDPSRLAKTLVIELDKQVVGDLMLAVEDAWSQREVQDHAQAVQAELGWALARGHWGHGYATEAALAVREWLQAPRVISLIAAGNVRSQGVAARLGATPGETIELPGHGPHVVWEHPR